jgi:hypothetical protein
MQKSVYYCPKCDRTVSRERLEQIEADMVERFGKSCLATMKCPVCDTDFIDLGDVQPGGERHVGEARRIQEG